MHDRAVPAGLSADRLDEWLALLAAQHGIVDLAQLRHFGITWSTVVAQVGARRWQRVVQRVYATFTGPLPRTSRLAAALRYGGPAALLSHRTAAEQWHLVPIQDGPIHITVPYGTSAISQPGLVVVHRSRAHRHIMVPADPPLTSPADTAIDLAVEEPDAVRARRMLIVVMTGGRVRPLDVERRLEERRPRRYRRALVDAVRMVRDGVLSALEELYATDVEQAHGIPKARRQAPMIVDGVTLYEDAVYDDIGIDLTVRLDGRTHLRNDVAFRDRRRDNAAELAGRSRLVFGWRDLSADPCGAADDVVRVLRRRGWDGELIRCPRCA
ncbi:hypothetical protein [Pseudonocardia acidicola]|uniref:hypothetical protein n=1 Tax=Pseudonocardia acidicola TaxID=2724939 RepID=UPI001B7D09A7|nr:hypothetical protein [Pseudonocardia acidicola]